MKEREKIEKIEAKKLKKLKCIEKFIIIENN